MSPETFWPASVWMPNPSPSTLIRRPARSEGAGFPRAVSRGGSRDDPSWPSGGRNETISVGRIKILAVPLSSEWIMRSIRVRRNMMMRREALVRSQLSSREKQSWGPLEKSPQTPLRRVLHLSLCPCIYGCCPRCGQLARSGEHLIGRHGDRLQRRDRARRDRSVAGRKEMRKQVGRMDTVSSALVCVCLCVRVF